MSGIITASTADAKFQASSSEMLRVEQDYQEYERSLQRQIDCVEKDLPGCHAYYYQVDPIGHDPYVLIAICSAVKPDFAYGDPIIQELLAKLKQPRRQYTLTITKAPAANSANPTDQPADISLPLSDADVTIKLTNYELSCTIDSLLNHRQLAAYAGYIRNMGGCPDLFPIEQYPNAVSPLPPLNYLVPAERLRKHPLLAKQLAIAEPLIGYPYVWSGSQPDTSFDCSGFIDYIMDSLGQRYRNNINGREVRLPVAGSEINGVFYDGIYEKCQLVPNDEKQPGDLVFFTGTFDAGYRSKNLTHVGIYVGDDIFLACNSPCGVSYRNYSDPDSKGRQWRSLLVGYARLTECIDQ